jgi:divalent metal cation (Fe/Co/Zn/Cd) transporter
LSKYLAFEEGKKAAWISVWTLLGIGVAEVIISTTTGSLTLLADGLDSALLHDSSRLQIIHISCL